MSRPADGVLVALSGSLRPGESASTLRVDPMEVRTMRTINVHIDDPNAALEQALIDEFLDSGHHSRQTLRALPEAEALPLLRAASDYASLRLAVIESRAHYVDTLRRSSA
jgi:hypothetical protein